MYFKKYLFFVLLYISCSIDSRKSENKDTIIISGNIENLPNGTMYLVGIPDRDRIIDSTYTTSGKFIFKISDKKHLFSKVSLKHKDPQNIVREISFPTSKLFNGAHNGIDYFLVDSNVLITGNLTDFIPKEFDLPSKLKLVTLSNQVSSKQNWVLNNVSLVFPEKPNEDKLVAALCKRINSYPYSYYLLSELVDHALTIDKQEYLKLLSLFNDDLLKTELGLRAKEIVTKLNEGGISGLYLLNEKGEKSLLIDDSKINIIVFWASWCVPCRKEIPKIKKLFADYGDSITISSISLDEDKEAWKKALKIEKMPWKQFIVKDNYEQKNLLYFMKAQPSIPLIVIADKKGNVLEKIVGYDQYRDLSKNIKPILQDEIKLNKVTK